MILFVALHTAFGGTVVQEREAFGLPEPVVDEGAPLESTLRARRSVRDFSPDPVSLAELGQLLWAAQGVNRPGGGRTAPSAGALYPLELLVAAGNVSGLPRGLYRYRPQRHDLVRVSGDDPREGLVGAALYQRWVGEAPVVLVICAVYERTAVKYGERARRYVHMEVGHAAQNVYLQAASLGLATTFVGAFRDDRVSEALGLGEEVPLGIMPVGRP